MSSAIASAPANGQVTLSREVREEISHWRFLESWPGFLPWRDEKHLRLSLSVDASGHSRGCVVHSSAGNRSFGDYWTEEQLALNTSTKEMLALVNALKVAPPEVEDCRVEVIVDSQVVIDTVAGQGSKSSPQLTTATKDLYLILVERNLHLKLLHVSSEHNRADGPSCHLSPLDYTLSSELWRLVEDEFGGASGHTFDLMALGSNARVGRNGETLPHFTAFPSPCSSGVNPYVFPPLNLIGPVVRFLCGFRVPFTIVVPVVHPVPFWWPWLMGFVSARLLLGSPGDLGVLKFPSKSGFRLVPSPVSLWACRVSRF